MAEHYYREIQGWFDWPSLSRAAVQASRPGGTLVEVGLWRGQSLACLLVEAAGAGKRLAVVGVDHFRGSVGEPALLAEAQAADLQTECRANCAKAGHPFDLITDPSPEAAAYFADGALDYVFLDASHDEASVRADIAAWLPKVRPGGILAGHDRGAAGVAAAVAALLPAAVPWDSCWVYFVCPEPDVAFLQTPALSADESEALKRALAKARSGEVRVLNEGAQYTPAEKPKEAARGPQK